MDHDGGPDPAVVGVSVGGQVLEEFGQGVAEELVVAVVLRRGLIDPTARAPVRAGVVAAGCGEVVQVGEQELGV
ncbi:hypothetical protein [Nocardioides terrisoli]|uniref:hypothetical protein n=1 Tax=Nocardioides terrisoli TaxID=3388267 RepID=UPI0037CAB4D7